MRWGTRTGVVLALLAIVAVVANASVRKENFKVGPGATEGGAAVCKGEENAIGGGFELEQKLSGPIGPERLAIHSTYPDGKRWKVEAYNLDGSEKRGSAFAICEKAKVLVKSKTVTGPEGASEAQATVKCPRGTKSLGGGGKGPGQNQRMRGSFPLNDGQGWAARFENVFGEKVKAFAICSRSAKGVKVVEDVVTADPGRARGGSQSEVRALAECPRGTQPVGGGHFSGNPSTVYFESKPVDGGWRIVAGAEEGASVIAFGVCARKV